MATLHGERQYEELVSLILAPLLSAAASSFLGYSLDTWMLARNKYRHNLVEEIIDFELSNVKVKRRVEVCGDKRALQTPESRPGCFGKTQCCPQTR